jgi:hypothetical protein
MDSLRLRRKLLYDTLAAELGRYAADQGQSFLTAMKLSIRVATFAFVFPTVALSQTSSAFLQALRTHTHEIGEKAVLAAAAMPAERFQVRTTNGAATFGELLLDLASRSDRYCASISGARAPSYGRLSPGAAKDSLVARVRKAFQFCETTLAEVDESGFSTVATATDWEYTINLQRSRAYVAVQAVAFWAGRYDELASALRSAGQVPPRVCIGGGDCDSGQNLCKSTTAGRPGGTLTLSAAPFSVAGDGRGVYVQGDGTDVEAANSLALIFTSVHNPEPASLRTITIDLSKPVPAGGGVPLGVLNGRALVSDTHAAGAAVDTTRVRTAYSSIMAQWYTDPDYTLHSVLDIPIGTTVGAEQLSVNFAIGGVAHVLQVGPQPMWHCYSDTPAVNGMGTTRATIFRQSATRWVVDLHTGSIGRLFDVHLLPANAVDKGLYYVSLHFTVDK